MCCCANCSGACVSINTAVPASKSFFASASGILGASAPSAWPWLSTSAFAGVVAAGRAALLTATGGFAGLLQAAIAVAANTNKNKILSLINKFTGNWQLVLVTDHCLLPTAYCLLPTAFCL